MSNPVIDKHGNKYWYNDDGDLHRLDGPAFEGFNGSKCWRLNGRLHRLDGPAWILVDVSNNEFWIDGRLVNEKDYPEAVLLYKCKQVLDT